MEYLPPLSSELNIIYLPEIATKVNGGAQNLIDNIKLKEFQPVYNAGVLNCFAVLRSYQKIELDVLGSGLKLILNPSFDINTPGTYSDFPVNLSFKLPIRDYLSDFNLSNFSGSFTDIYTLLLDVLNIEEIELLYYFVSNVFPTGNIENFKDDINQHFNLNTPLNLTVTNDLYQDTISLI